MTLKQLAKLANVSVSTVSKALNGSFDLSDEMIRHVNAVAQKHGYFTDKKAITMENKKVKQFKIAILCPEIISYHYSSIATNIRDALTAQGVLVQLYICDFDIDSELRLLTECLKDSGISGVVSLFGEKQQIDFALPIVKISPENLNYSSIRSVMEEGIEEAVRYLHGLGHRDIMFVGEQLAMKKVTDFYTAMKKLNIPIFPTSVFISEKRFEEAGCDAVNMILGGNNPHPTAIITAYDEIALGVMHELVKNKINVPDDISVIGINDIAAAKYSVIPLTTVRIDCVEYGKKIARMIMELVGGVFEHRHENIRAELIVRQSTAKPCR